MEKLTCIVDATTFIEKIHAIKDYVYEGNVSLHIPKCTSEKLEQIYQVSLIPKEKEASLKRSSYKATARKEQPLFDLNPRIAREFISRCQLDTGNSRVTFQLLNEQFTQWKEEEQVAIKAEQTPEERPTSFAQALLRKLNITGEEDGVSKVPAKPRLVARDATAPKSPWKYHKVPTISTKGIPVSMKSILSCVLWRLHEYENNPLMPESFVLLTNDIELRTLAQKLDIPTLNFQEIHQRLEKMHLVDHDRQTVGQLEEEFSPEKREKVTIDVKRDANWKEDRVEPDSVKDVSVMEPQDQEAQVEESNKETLNCELTNDTPKDPVIEIAAGQSERFEDIPDEAEKARGAGSPKVNGVHPLNNEEKVVASVYSSPEDHSSDHLSGFEGKVSPIENATVEALKETTRDINITGKQQKSSSTSSSHVYGTVSESVGTSDDSDEDEVVVFDPRSRRFSGRPKTPNEITKPPPAISYIRALETGLPKKPVVTPKPSIPVAQQQNQKIQQPEIPNEVKPEGTKPQIPTMPDVQEASAKNVTSAQRRHLNRRPEPLQYSLHTAPKSQNQVPAQIQSRPDILPVEVSGPSKNTSPPKSPQRKKSDEQIVLEPVDQDGRRYQNQGTINRPSHPAVQRVDRAFAKSQRQIHKPQRPFPVIDPDAFDRSYIVRPHNHAPNTNHRVMSPRGSPRGGPRTPESEVDYVLKSGSPRGATRGRGKLWVP